MLGICYKVFFIISSFSLSLEACHKKCKLCFGYSDDINDQKCVTCKMPDIDSLLLPNCVNKYYYPNYDNYNNNSGVDYYLQSCSSYRGTNCYECKRKYNDIYGGICLSCLQGYEYYNSSKKCVKCGENEYKVIYGDFDCERGIKSGPYCNKYITKCYPIKNKNIECPEDTPFFDNLTNTCYEYKCPNVGFNNSICTFIGNKKYKERSPLLINWFNQKVEDIPFISLNTDNSKCLLMELSGGGYFTEDYKIEIPKNNNRILYFYNEEGRGLFDSINDVYEKVVELDKNFIRGVSTSIFIKGNSSTHYRYFLNFENYNNILEFFDLKTGNIKADNIYDVFQVVGKVSVGESEKYNSFILQFLELKESEYLLAFKSSKVLVFIFSLDEIPGKDINIYSLNIKKQFILPNLPSDNTKLYFIQTKKGHFF